MFSQGKNICFTVNNPQEQLNPDWWTEDEQTNTRFVVWQLEMGESGTPHLQGYMELKQTKRLRQIQAMEGLTGGHFETRRGTKAQAIDYCKKDEGRLEGPWFWPDEQTVNASLVGQGQRTDLERFTQALAAGAQDRELALEQPVTYLKFSQHAQRFRMALGNRVRDHRVPITLTFVIGPTRTGKSHMLAETYPKGSQYYWAQPGKGQWWDGYQGQTTVVFDEMRDSWFPWSYLLRLWDNKPLQVEVKGAYIEMLATNFIVSTNLHPRKWYKHVEANQDWMRSPLKARVTHWNYMTVRHPLAPDVVADPETYIGADEEAEQGPPLKVRVVDGVPVLFAKGDEPGQNAAMQALVEVAAEPDLRFIGEGNDWPEENLLADDEAKELENYAEKAQQRWVAHQLGDHKLCLPRECHLLERPPKKIL